MPIRSLLFVIITCYRHSESVETLSHYIYICALHSV